MNSFNPELQHGYAIFRFLPTGGSKWINPEEFDSNKYSSNSSKSCVLKINLVYSKELRELHNDYLDYPDKIEIKKKVV